MFERFTREAKATVLRALDVAQRAGAEQVEPEHMLLALAGGHADAASRAIAEAGIDVGAIERAIEQDLVAALEVVGVPASVVASTPALPRADRPGFAVATKEALEQAMKEAVRRGDRRLGREHVLLGLLSPPAVSLARVLRALDVAPPRLAELVQVEMAARR
ncbi:MAG TPA: Clp protease N-terminal domain-containing protein [Solirubrobacteraceae bacterium]|jgi:ATP-dependent Clp protease ATP-binding subunit ClpA|nr:Clp protease N-terminal domain-containing protein [Solirubrobacteraceae bacterium]